MPGSFRSGPDNPRSGPRLPRPRGPFCIDCKDPETPGNRVIVGLWGFVRFNMEVPICERCIRDRAPRLDPDPRTIEEAA